MKETDPDSLTPIIMRKDFSGGASEDFLDFKFDPSNDFGDFLCKPKEQAQEEEEKVLFNVG